MPKFVAWDGEGRNGNYWLLQNSLGEVWTKDNLSIYDVLPALVKPGVVNVWYGAGYDWNMLFRDCPRELQKDLFRGKICLNPKHEHLQRHYGFSEKETEIDGYDISIFPKKIFRVISPNHDVGQGIHYDVIGFFQCSFLKALEQWKIPVPEIIERGKAERDRFGEWKEQDIIAYNGEECKLLVEMMNRLQAALEKVNLGDLAGYYGAGAIAAKMLDDMNVLDHMVQPSNKLRDLTYQAYYGGRIELFKRGEYGPVYNYDINSAYPSASRFLPDLKESNEVWVKNNEILDYDFGIAKVNWSLRDCRIMGPFPMRGDGDWLSKGTIAFPPSGQGAYFLNEVKAAIKKDLWDIEVTGGWALENGYATPFKEPIERLMKKRLELKKAKDFANIPLKLGANSFYGKFAQRNKDKHQFGYYANYLYAGFVTSHTRTELLTQSVPEANILLCTDGIYSTQPLTCSIGEGLGQWEYDFYTKGRFILPGIYQLENDQGKKTVKSRGFPKFNFDEVYGMVMIGKKPQVSDNLFVGIRRALKQYKKYPRCGFYPIVKKVDWHSEKRPIWVGNDYSEPPTGFWTDEGGQRFLGVNQAFRPWIDGKKEMEIEMEFTDFD